jgi:DNA polymerase III epsilon subunit-like protein
VPADAQQPLQQRSLVNPALPFTPPVSSAITPAIVAPSSLDFESRQSLSAFHNTLIPPGCSNSDKVYQRQSEIVSLFTPKWLSLACSEFIALDLETTGLSKYHDSIVEIAAIKYQNCVETDKFVTLVNPNVSIPPGATYIHGITNEMVKDYPTIETIMPQLLHFLGDKLLAGHNAHFDVGFIEVGAKRL